MTLDKNLYKRDTLHLTSRFCKDELDSISTTRAYQDTFSKQKHI